MHSANILMLQEVAKGLGELLEKVVFVGGAVAELYADDPASSGIRPTLDIDCVIEINSRKEFNNLEKILRLKGFVNDISPGAPICRWIYSDIKVDVMATEENVLGFSNLWYREGSEKKIVKFLPDGTAISIFPLEYYLASKFEALRNRGGHDLRQSHDFEDIIYILNSSLGVRESIANALPFVKTYLIGKLKEILSDSNSSEAIETALPYGSGDERTEMILKLIRWMVGED
jgi:hypothetical protein